MERLSLAGIEFTVFFYNPNIHPQKEYLLRKDENMQFASRLGISFIDGDYDAKKWMERARGLEWEPERGKRCTMCFDMRLEQTARYAHEHGFDTFTSSLGISRWKNLQQVNECGERAAAAFPELNYWPYNWRKQGGSSRTVEIAKQEHFYQQEYCGCVYSLRDANNWRVQHHRDRIKIGVQYYQS
ncbi:MAG: Epoxyqueuosine reductase QueH [Candidatus Celerinatantimonas neptuna]|nr:MAG: Epoxyqueuosine reductase QueH [Candidatus Celerinatantimonas neptuna]